MSIQDNLNDIAVIGAGAAGLAAGIFAREAAEGAGPRRIVILDGARKIGAKILISGGGRCNVAHEVVTPQDFCGNRLIIKNVLAAFPVTRTINWFASMGVALKREDTGKLFPVTDKARTILSALLERCRDLDIAIHPAHRVTGLERSVGSEPGFLLHHTHGTLRAKKIILATGGRSLPNTGSDGFGYSLARRLGHSLTPTVPALVPLVLNDSMFHRMLSGLSQEVELTTIVDGRRIDSRKGSLLWTHFGVSGPVVMDASHGWTVAQDAAQSATILGNFFPGETQEQVQRWFMEEAASHPQRSVVKTLGLRLPDRFAETLCLHIGSHPYKAIAQLPRTDRDHLIAALTKFPFPIERDRGWNFAEVTAGGIPLEEIDFRSMESRLVPGLYVVGEILDCTGRIGGFNFQWAWSTGFVAGQAAGKSR